jgi:quinol monooxygenase YgiN
MLSEALFVRLEARPGKEEDVATFLDSALALVDREPKTPVWFAVRFGPTTFGIFDAFPDEEGRQDHLAGSVAAALTERADELFAATPVIERCDVLATKVLREEEGPPPAPGATASA